MSEIECRSDFSVELVDSMGSDASFVQAAKVSTLRDRQGGDNDLDIRRFLSFLMKNRHHSPFEMGCLKFRVEAPIFVVREWMRHRVSSFNEASGRYTEMLPVFYVPDAAVRPLSQVGKPGAYTYSMERNSELAADVRVEMRDSTLFCWRRYQQLLNLGVAKEVARMVLPVNIYTRFYYQVNPRSLMNFLSLRTESVEGVSSVPSFPLWEIARCADQMEELFKGAFPVTWDVWNENGREGA